MIAGMPNKEDVRTRPTVVLTLGRLPPALDIARGFAGLGWRVIVAEPFGMHLCRMSRAVTRSYRIARPDLHPGQYLDELADVIEREGATLVIPVSEETPHVARLHDRVAASVRIFAGRTDDVLALHDKFRFAELAARAGLPVAQSQLPDAAPKQAPWDLVIKPRLSCSGRGVRFVARGEATAAEPGYVVQRRIRGSEYSGFGVCVDGQLRAPVVYRSTISSGSVAVCFERVDDQPAIIEWMRDFAATIDSPGFLAFDFIVDANGVPHALECNPRVTSGIHFLSRTAVADLILGREVEAGPVRAERLLTESWSCYTACLGRLTRPREFLRSLRLLHRATDVTWSRQDPLPFLLMPVNTSRIIRDALLSGSTFAEVAVRDVEWREPAESRAHS